MASKTLERLPVAPAVPGLPEDAPANAPAAKAAPPVGAMEAPVLAHADDHADAQGLGALRLHSIRTVLGQRFPTWRKATVLNLSGMTVPTSRLPAATVRRHRLPFPLLSLDLRAACCFAEYGQGIFLRERRAKIEAALRADPAPGRMIGLLRLLGQAQGLGLHDGDAAEYLASLGVVGCGLVPVPVTLSPTAVEADLEGPVPVIAQNMAQAQMMDAVAALTGQGGLRKLFTIAGAEVVGCGPAVAWTDPLVARSPFHIHLGPSVDDCDRPGVMDSFALRRPVLQFVPSDQRRLRGRVVTHEGQGLLCRDVRSLAAAVADLTTDSHYTGQLAARAVLDVGRYNETVLEALTRVFPSFCV